MGPKENDQEVPVKPTALATDGEIRAFFALAGEALHNTTTPVDVAEIVGELNPLITAAFDAVGQEAAGRVSQANVEEMIEKLRKPPQEEAE